MKLTESSILLPVIENVPGAPLLNPIRLCGEMFGLGVIRHRLFESNVPLLALAHKRHKPPIIIRGVQRSAYACVAGHGGEGYTYRLEDWRTAMGINWMDKKELVESIPPAYSTWIGERILEHERRVNGSLS